MPRWACSMRRATPELLSRSCRFGVMHSLRQRDVTGTNSGTSSGQSAMPMSPVAEVRMPVRVIVAMAQTSSRHPVRVVSQRRATCNQASRRARAADLASNRRLGRVALAIYGMSKSVMRKSVMSIVAACAATTAEIMFNIARIAHRREVDRRWTALLCSPR